MQTSYFDIAQLLFPNFPRIEEIRSLERFAAASLDDSTSSVQVAWGVVLILHQELVGAV